jgi:hypothetical protein
MSMHRALAALACALLLAGCSKSHEVISNHNVRGEISMSVDNGAAGAAVQLPLGTLEKVPTRHHREKPPSTADGTVEDWNTIRVRGHAQQGAPVPKPPPVPGPKVEVTVIANATSEFELKQDRRDVDMKIDLHWSATLRAGHASIAVTGVVSDAHGVVCNVAGSYELVTDPADNTRITVTPGGGGKPFGMVNGGGSSDQHLGAPTCSLDHGTYQLRWSVALIVQGDPFADVDLDTARLHLTR